MIFNSESWSFVLILLISFAGWLSFSTKQQDKEDQSQIVGYTRHVSVAASKLLLAGKALAADPNAPNVKTNLAAAARYEVGYCC